MIVCENCIHRYVCEDKYTMEPQYGCINYNSGKYMVIEELEKIKEEVSRYGAIWVQYKIKGHSERDIENIVEEVLKQAKSGFIDYLDKHISELKGENK